MSTPYVTNLLATNHVISIDTANELIKRFDDCVADILNGRFADKNPFTKSQTFDIVQVQGLLNQSGCVALRSYFGLYGDENLPDPSKSGKIVLVLCGVDEDGNDLNLAIGDPETDQLILENGQLCPPICSTPSQINNL